MPDRQRVLDNPTEGMYIHYSHSSTSWVIIIDAELPHVSYVYKVNISTMEEAMKIPRRQWARGRVYNSEESWSKFLNKAGGSVTILSERKPSWEV